FDPVTGAVLRSASSPVLATEGYDLQGLAWRGRRLYAGDRRRGARGYTIHVLEADDACGLTPTDRRIDLPPPPLPLRPAPRRIEGRNDELVVRRYRNGSGPMIPSGLPACP